MTTDLASVDPVVLVYATRYALGRLTAAPIGVAAAVRANAHTLDAGCRDAIFRDVEAHLLGRDRGSGEMTTWRPVLEALAPGEDAPA